MPYGSVGGMERLASTFYRHYKSQGFDVFGLKIIKLKSDIIDFGDDELFLSEIDLSEMPAMKRALFYLQAPLKIRKIVREKGITHSIAFGDMANVFSSLTFTNEFKIASIHALKSVEFSSNNPLNQIFRLAYRTSYRNFSKVVCISEAIRKDLIANCGFAFPNKLQVIYNPHDIPAIQRMSQEQIPTDEAAWFEGKSIVFLGRLSMQKAPWHLVNAFKILTGKIKDTQLIFIGDGDPEIDAYIRQRVRRLGLEPLVIFAGRRTNPYKYLVKADVLALSSYYEGTPNVIVEAMALGVPTVSSNSTDGIAEIMSLAKPDVSGSLLLTESGIITPGFFDGSLTIPIEDKKISEEAAFATALEMVLQDSRFRASLEHSKLQLLERFDLQKVAESYLDKNRSTSHLKQ